MAFILSFFALVHPFAAPVGLANLCFFARLGYFRSNTRPRTRIVLALASVVGMAFGGYLIGVKIISLLGEDNPPRHVPALGYYLWLASGIVLLVASVVSARLRRAPAKASHGLGAQETPCAAAQGMPGRHE